MDNLDLAQMLYGLAPTLIAGGAARVAINVMAQRAALALERQRVAGHVAVGLAGAQWQPQLPALTHWQGAALPGGIGAPALPPAGEGLPGLPGVTTLGSVLATGWRPSRDNLLMALGPDGVRYTTSLGKLVHVLMIGPTGVGKSNIARLLLPQIATLPGVETEWWNPHYTPRDPETGEEWAPIAAATRRGAALTTPDAIMAALETLVFQDLPARKARYAAGQHPGPARFVLVDEVPVLSADKRFMEWIGQILREGRKFGLFIMMATQDALIKTLGGSTGLRANAQTVFYGGGDAVSARALLGFTPPDPPGQGVVYLKSAATPQAALVRVPLVENRDIVTLLGDGGNPISPRFSPVSAGSITVSAPVSVLDVLQAPETAPETGGVDPAKRAAFLIGLAERRGIAELGQEIWGAKPGAGAAWKAAQKDITQILADLVGEG